MESRDFRHDGPATHEAADAPPADSVGEPFVFERFFEGGVRGWGFFEDRFRKIRSRFDIEMTGRWHDEIFVIDNAPTDGSAGMIARVDVVENEIPWLLKAL